MDNEGKRAKVNTWRNTYGSIYSILFLITIVLRRIDIISLKMQLIIVVLAAVPLIILLILSQKYKEPEEEKEYLTEDDLLPPVFDVFKKH